VLITGESGTGKELVSRLIHTLDPGVERRELVILDCTTIVPELIGSELFGHERGAFTGATGARDGAFALSDHGTLFLDEIGELPLSLQPQLLRVIQERTFKRIGGNHWSSTHFRLVCATHRDFAAEIGAGRFRADLYYRIATCKLALPPLRERRQDIGPLAEHFFRELSPTGAAPELTPAVRELLEQREYPGNVRELRQLVARIAARHVGTGPVSVGDVPEDERPDVDVAGTRWQTVEFEAAIQRALALGAPLKDLSHYLSETAVRLAVDEEQGNLQRAARRLGVTDRALQMRRASVKQGRDAA
jgi:transcriptional regulator with GAF, ATPase, and Fis domain